MKPDLIGAIITLLRADSDVQEEVGQRVFGRLSRERVDEYVRTHERIIIVERFPAAFGGFRRSYTPMGNTGFSLRCMGPTMQAADAVYRAADPVLKFAERQVVSDVLVQSVIPLGDATQGLDTDANDWPFLFATYNALASEVAV